MEWLNVILNLAIIFGGGVIFISIADYVLGLFIRIKP
jgi:hypothetical protein